MKERPVLESIIAEIHRRAEKEWAGGGYDFEVTITADEYKALCEEEAAIISRDNWISVKDRQPDTHGEYLAATKARPRGWVTTYAPVGWICSEAYPVTHWMPLPEPPEGQSQ